MNSELNNFFKEEQKRVFEPGPYFTQRVMSRLASARSLAPSMWEALPSASRPVMAAALVVLFAVLMLQIMAPVQPNRSAIEAYLNKDLSPREQLLIVNPGMSVEPIQLDDLIFSEPGE